MRAVIMRHHRSFSTRWVCARFGAGNAAGIAMVEDGKRGERPGPPVEAPLAPSAQASEGSELARLRADCAQLLDTTQRLQAAARRRDDLLALAAADLEGP